MMNVAGGLLCSFYREDVPARSQDEYKAPHAYRGTPPRLKRGRNKELAQAESASRLDRFNQIKVAGYPMHFGKGAPRTAVEHMHATARRKYQESAAND